MTGPMRRTARLSLAAALGLVALLLGGCVYLRLLELKKQFARFDENFTLETAHGLKLRARDPVLRASDVRWIGIRPETIDKLGGAERWHVRWLKQLPEGVTEESKFFIALELMFAGGKLSGITIPETYFELLPKDFVVGVVRSLGGAAIDKSSREVAAAISADEIRQARPRLPAIDKILGVPTEERVEGRFTVQRYRYIPATAEPGGQAFEMWLRYETKTGELLHWQGRTPVGNIAFDFSKDRPAP